LLDGRGGLIGFLVLLMRTLRDAVGAVGERGDAGRNLAGRVADLTNQLVEVFHHFIENLRRPADFIIALDWQATGQVAFAPGNVGETAAHGLERLADKMVGDQVDEDEQGAQCGDCNAGNLETEGRYLRLDGVERYLHADDAKHGAFRDLMAKDAVLAEVVFRGLGRVDDMQERAAVGAFNRHVRVAAGHHFLFQGIERPLALGVGAVQFDHGIAAGNDQILDDGELFDLVEKDFALADGAGQHHAG
jgi:hypothetical protein